MNIIKSISIFSFFTLISRVLGYLRDILMAIFLGTSFLADAFFVAFRIPNTFRRLFSEGTFNAAFVPSYSLEMLKGKIKSNKFASEVFSLLFLFLSILVLLVQIFMPAFVSLIAPGFVEDDEKIQLAINLTRIIFPFLLLISLASFFSGILNSHNRFAEAAAAPIILNIVLIIVLLFNKLLNDDLVYYLSYAVTFSGLLQFIFLYFFVRKFVRLNLNLSFKISNNIKIFFKKLVPTIFSSGVVQINILIGTILASFQASAVSYLYYADRIYQINLAIAGTAIGIVILPQLSKHIIKKSKKKINLIQNKALELSLFLSLPATFALIIGSNDIISALFGYGQFNELSVSNSAKALYYFALGLPSFVLGRIFASFFFANQDTKTPYYVSLMTVMLNILISVYFLRSIGFIIIPIATSISSWFNTIVFFLILRKRNLFNFNSIFINRFFKIILCSLLMGIFFYYLLILFQHQLLFDQTFKFLYLILSVVIAISFYMFMSYLIGAFKIKDFKLKY